MEEIVNIKKKYCQFPQTCSISSNRLTCPELVKERPDEPLIALRRLESTTCSSSSCSPCSSCLFFELEAETPERARRRLMRASESYE